MNRLPISLFLPIEKSKHLEQKKTTPNNPDFFSTLFEDDDEKKEAVLLLINSDVHDKLSVTLNSCIRNQKKTEKIDECTEMALPEFSPLHFSTLPSSAEEKAAPIELAQEQIQAFFKEMVGGIKYLCTSGVQETTLFLNSQEFASSAFYGTKITITEYSTAPKIFNVNLSFASTQALHLFHPYATQLAAALQKKNEQFQVNRLDADLSSDEHPLLQRKPKKEHDKSHKQKKDNQ